MSLSPFVPGPHCRGAVEVLDGFLAGREPSAPPAFAWAPVARGLVALMIPAVRLDPHDDLPVSQAVDRAGVGARALRGFLVGCWDHHLAPFRFFARAATVYK